MESWVPDFFDAVFGGAASSAFGSLGSGRVSAGAGFVAGLADSETLAWITFLEGGADFPVEASFVVLRGVRFFAARFSVFPFAAAGFFAVAAFGAAILEETALVAAALRGTGADFLAVFAAFGAGIFLAVLVRLFFGPVRLSDFIGIQQAAIVPAVQYRQACTGRNGNHRAIGAKSLSENVEMAIQRDCLTSTAR